MYVRWLQLLIIMGWFIGILKRDCLRLFVFYKLVMFMERG